MRMRVVVEEPVGGWLEGVFFSVSGEGEIDCWWVGVVFFFYLWLGD